MFFNLILVFCIMQNASSISRKHNSEIQLRNFNRHGGEFLNYNKIDEKPSKRLFKEDSLDLSSESKRVFYWVKSMINKNENKVTTPSYDEVLNERTRLRQIEKNLTETLIKLSRVLTQVLNIVKYAHFDDVHQFLPTKLGSKQMNKRDYLFRRNSNKGDIVLAKLDISNSQENNKNKRDIVKDSNNILPTKLSSANFNSHENKTKIGSNKSGNIVQQENQTKSSNLTVHVPAKIQETRVKRDVTELKKSVTEKPGTLKVEKGEVEKGEVENKNGSVKMEVADTTTDAEIGKTGRRAILPKEVNNDEVKNHLFKYIDEAFSEIANKINSLKQTKQVFSKDVSYQVGYIISNIDTLEVNMRNMKRDMDINKYVWDDKKILNLYDTVKVSNQAVADLLEILKSYV